MLWLKSLLYPSDRSSHTSRLTPLLTTIFLAIGAVLTTTASFVFGVGWLMPILCAAVVYPVFLIHVGYGQYGSALGWVLLWAVFQSIAVAVGTAIAPERATEVVLSGATYTEETLDWIRTGDGPGGTPQLFVPIHVRDYVMFCLLSLLTFGSAALILGTWLLNYMNYYVAILVKMSANPWLAATIAWPPWSLARVIGYISTGVALTALSLHLVAKARGKVPQYPFPKKYLFIGIGFVVADLILKTLLTPIWRQLLLSALGE